VNWTGAKSSLDLGDVASAKVADMDESVTP
jgi:hypothetical protein